jgi:hypothetical protein
MNNTHNTMTAKLISSLRSARASSKQQILKDHIQHVNVKLTVKEMREYIAHADFVEEDASDYFLSFTLDDLEPLTSEEREAFCRDEDTITVGIWVPKVLCKGVDTDNGICNEEAWQYTWHGN